MTSFVFSSLSVPPELDKEGLDLVESEDRERFGRQGLADWVSRGGKARRESTERCALCGWFAYVVGGIDKTFSSRLESEVKELLTEFCTHGEDIDRTWVTALEEGGEVSSIESLLKNVGKVYQS